MEVDVFFPESRRAWREWLLENHEREDSVWLGYYKTKSGVPTIRYTEAVDEALCFGWIDSKVQPVDESRYRQLFTKRKPKSVWSKVNKEKVARLTEQGLMMEAGLKSIELAKENGSWTILDDAENLVMPDDLRKKFESNAAALGYFNSLSRTTRRNILQWITLAKKPGTRQKRIQETFAGAVEKTVPKPFQTRK